MMKLRKIIATVTAVLTLLSCNLMAFATADSKQDLSGVTYKEVFAGATIAVSDKTTQAVRMGAYEWPITAKTKVYFIADGGANLGYMTGDAYMAMVTKYQKEYMDILYSMPGGDDGFYAQMFNDYRGVKRLTVDEYLEVNRISPLTLSSEGRSILEQVYRKSTPASNADSSTASDGAADSGAPAASGGSAATSAQFEQYRKEVFRLVNVERVKAGLPEVVWDDDFAACAQIRAEEMTRKKGHERPVTPRDSGTKWPVNANGKGIYNAPSVADEQGVPHKWIMENAGYGYGTAEAVVKGWMNSPGHKANILKESHVRCGVGVYYAKEYPPEGCQIGWALWFDDYDGTSSSSKSSSSGKGTASNGITYSLNKSELNLSAGEGYQLEVKASGAAKDVEIEWVGSKIGKDILAVDDNGYITTFYREGLTSATATLNVSAKIYASGKLVKTLNCKVIVTQ